MKKQHLLKGMILTREDLRMIKGGNGKSKLAPPPVPMYSGAISTNAGACRMCCWTGGINCSKCVVASSAALCVTGASLVDCICTVPAT